MNLRKIKFIISKFHMNYVFSLSNGSDSCLYWRYNSCVFYDCRGIRIRIRTGSNIEHETRVGSITEGKHIIHMKLKETMHENPYTEGTVKVVVFIWAI